MAITLGVSGMAAYGQDSTVQKATFRNDENPSLDVIGDPLPEHALMRFGTHRFQHPSSVNSLLLAPDEKTILSIGYEYLIGWDTATGRELWRESVSDKGITISGPAYGQRFMVFAEDSSQFYTVGNNQLHNWNTRTGLSSPKALQAGNVLGDLANAFRGGGNAAGAGFSSIDVTPDASQFLLGNASGLSLFSSQRGKKIWSVSNDLEEAAQFENDRDRLHFGGSICTAVFSPNGQIVAAVLSESPKTITLLDCETGKETGAITLTDKLVRMVFTPDGASIVTTERDCGIRRYAVDSREREWELKLPPDPNGAESYTSAVDITSDGKLVAACAPVGARNWIYLVDAGTGEEVAILKSVTWKPWAVQFTGDGKTLYSSGWGASIQKWDVESATELPLPEGSRASSTVTLSPSGLYSAFCDGAGKVQIVDTQTGSELQTITPEKAKTGAALLFSADDSVLHIGGTTDETVAVESWDWAKREQLSVWEWPKGKDNHSDVEELACDPSGRYVAAAVFRQDSVYLWDTKSGESVATLKHNNVYGLDIAPDGRFIATAGWDKMLRIWSTADGEMIKQINVVEDANKEVDPMAIRADRRMYTVCYSPSGSELACAYMDGVVGIWSIPEAGDVSVPSDLELVNVFNIGGSFVFGALDYSPDGVWVAAGNAGGQVRLFDASSGDRVFEVGRHEDHVYTVRFGADSRHLVSGGGGVSYYWSLVPEAGDTDIPPAELWKQLNEKDADRAYQAIWAFANNELAAEYLIERLHEVTTVLDPAMITRGMESPAAERRLALMEKAADGDAKVEHLRVVQRALAALRLCEIPGAAGGLEWMAVEHPSTVVNKYARRLLPFGADVK